MAGLSPDELRAIKAHSLKKGLENFRLTFTLEHLTGKNANLTEVIDQLTSKASNRGAEDVILDLILALQSQPAARIIRSRSGNGPLSGDIAAFYARISSNMEQSKPVGPLLQVVITQESGVTHQ